LASAAHAVELTSNAPDNDCSKSKKKYYFNKCDERTNGGQRYTCPNVRREKIDEAVAVITFCIDVAKSQLAIGIRKITPAVLEKFSQQLSAKLHNGDSTLRNAYLRMLVSEVRVSKEICAEAGAGQGAHPCGGKSTHLRPEMVPLR